MSSLKKKKKIFGHPLGTTEEKQRISSCETPEHKQSAKPFRIPLLWDTAIRYWIFKARLLEAKLVSSSSRVGHILGHIPQEHICQQHRCLDFQSPHFRRLLEPALRCKN
jgi:hypothetical protein